MQTLHLIRPHRHAGRNYPAGSQIRLPERKAAWLIGLGAARAAGPDKPADKPADKTQKTPKE